MSAPFYADLEVFLLLVCGGTLALDVTGYLPGEAYGYLPLFFTLAVVYLCLGIVWMVVCMAYIKVKSLAMMVRSTFVSALMVRNYARASNILMGDSSNP